MAGALLGSVPVAIIYLLCQYYVAGLTAGAVKADDDRGLKMEDCGIMVRLKTPWIPSNGRPGGGRCLSRHAIGWGLITAQCCYWCCNSLERGVALSVIGVWGISWLWGLPSPLPVPGATLALTPAASWGTVGDDDRSAAGSVMKRLSVCDIVAGIALLILED
jgi:hypothetical protein